MRPPVCEQIAFFEGIIAFLYKTLEKYRNMWVLNTQHKPKLQKMMTEHTLIAHIQRCQVTLHNTLSTRPYQYT